MAKRVSKKQAKQAASVIGNYAKSKTKSGYKTASKYAKTGVKGVNSFFKKLFK